MNNIAPINKGIQVLQEGTNFLSGVFLRWLKDVADRLNRAVVTDENGNIAYGGFSLPTDLSDEYRYEFYDCSCVMTRRDGANGNYYICNNCYYNGSTWIAMCTIATAASYSVLTGTSFLIRQSASGSVTAGDDLGIFVTVITPS